MVGAGGALIRSQLYNDADIVLGWLLLITGVILLIIYGANGDGGGD